jgi:hypothetical protein
VYRIGDGLTQRWRRVLYYANRMKTLHSGFCCALAKMTKSSSTYSIAEYQTQLPDKNLLQAKLHEFYSLNIDEV